MANVYYGCAECGNTSMNDSEKIIFQDMEFCDIKCFMNSKYYDGNIVEQDDYEELMESFKQSEDQKATIEATNNQSISALSKLLESYDDDFEKGNAQLDEILLKIDEIKENMIV